MPARRCWSPPSASVSGSGLLGPADLVALTVVGRGPASEFRRSARVALMRYSSAMATIQVREIPDEHYEVLRRRARRAGQSMQAYMRGQIVALAARPTKEEAIEEIEAVKRLLPAGEPSVASIVADIAADRR